MKLNLNLDNVKKVHFIGIGGIGMSALAFVLNSYGIIVTGSDKNESEITQRLKKSGVIIFSSHESQNVSEDIDLVVYSTAIKNENPEIKIARELNLNICHRSDVLNLLLKEKYSIAITGTHGKTSTSAIMAKVLLSGGYDPTAIIGGKVLDFNNNNAIAGKSKYLVAEVDESDQSIKNLTANIAVITNLETDHPDHYKDLAEIVTTMEKFIDNMPDSGVLILGIDSNPLKQISESTKKEVITYSIIDKNADYFAEITNSDSFGSTFTVYYQNSLVGSFTINISGDHYVANSLSVIACARFIGLEESKIKSALESYVGVKRRFEKIAEIEKTLIVDDYAHHPTEVKATLESAKLQNKYITAIFQPHRYSRTKAFFKEFSESFDLADQVIITDVYGAGEQEVDFNVNSEGLANLISKRLENQDVKYIPDFESIITYLQEHKHSDSIILTIGAGSITNLSYSLKEKLFLLPKVS